MKNIDEMIVSEGKKIKINEIEKMKKRNGIGRDKLVRVEDMRI